ncbi:hypothetical protein [Silvimonas iriomotensis]|uniref:Uncharacterized protein n=1 Tax=Silvimonas iriomotensis TaxID=449662 RepID=A0ABQ2PE18_9NEIS|nr:hypothetical protein [Silvimonas iriomotensis]GGP23484.1 hypothetical protein GCM10010970_34840 [Silvimonas iriomotensis]
MNRIALASGVAGLLLLVAAPAQAMYTAWPFNGRVINHSMQEVKAWDGEHDFYSIRAGMTSSNLYDVDHIQLAGDADWCKLGANTVTVTPDGRMSGCECRVAHAADECAPTEQRSLLSQVASVFFGRQRTDTVLAYLTRVTPLRRV